MTNTNVLMRAMHQPFTSVNVGRCQNATLGEGVSAEMNELRLTKIVHDVMR